MRASGLETDLMAARSSAASALHGGSRRGLEEQSQIKFLEVREL